MNSHKGRKRLSSLFSSNSLSSQARDRDSPEPIRRGSSLVPGSGNSTPTRELPPSVPTKKYPGLGVEKGTTEGITEGVNLIGLGPAVDSPTSERPPDGPLSGSSPTTSKTAKTKKLERTEYSRWVESDEDTSDEELAFATPSEGLSEVEEDDEDADEEAVIVNRKSATSTATTTTTTPSEKEKVVPSPHPGSKSMVDSEDVLGTGPSTMRRTKHARITQVVRHLHSSKESALSIDQNALLAPDLDTCREALTLFLTSQMQKAEKLCTEKDPEANHLYLLSAGGIIQALKVRSFLENRGIKKLMTGNDDFRFKRSWECFGNHPWNSSSSYSTT
jgi:hypothetical protein